MYDFILQIFLMASLAFIIYLMARSLPRVPEGESHATAYDYLEGWIKKLPLESIDRSLGLYSEKTLKKVRVTVMRFDNFLQKLLNNKKNGNQLNTDNKDLISSLREKNNNKP